MESIEYTGCEVCGQFININLNTNCIRIKYKVYPPRQKVTGTDEIYGYDLFTKIGFYALVYTGKKSDRCVICEKCMKNYGVYHE